MTTKIREALELGQQIWLDSLSRGMLKNGRIDQWLEKGVTGITTNPTIFSQSIVDRDMYPELADFPKDKPCVPALLDALCEDVAAAADKLRPLYDSSNGEQGYVSIELNPRFAEDVETSLKEAELVVRKMGQRPNFMIKVASNAEGLRIMKELLSRGVNVNMTLIFEPFRICAVMDMAIEAHIAREQKAPGAVFPQLVMSVFLSRMDGEMDKTLKEAGVEDGEDMMGRTALHVSRVAAFQREANLLTGGWEKVIEQGRAPRIVWASTSAKNDRTPDTFYVDNFVMRDTINTVPEKTLEAFLDHGVVKENYDPEQHNESVRFAMKLKDLGANPSQVAETLLEKGIEQFREAYDNIIKAVKGEDADLDWEYEEMKKFLNQ